jgi:hypothetical protein
MSAMSGSILPRVVMSSRLSPGHHARPFVRAFFSSTQRPHTLWKKS